MTGFCGRVPVVDVLQSLFKLAQDFGWGGPLHASAVIFHGLHVFKATVDFADVRLDLVASVGLQDDMGGAHTPVSHSSQSPPPHLDTEEPWNENTGI